MSETDARAAREVVVCSGVIDSPKLLLLSGIGAASHLCGMLFMQALDVPLVTVPYKGTGPAMTDLLGGQVDAAFVNINSFCQAE